MLKIEMPSGLTPQRRYILRVLLNDRLGLDWTLRQTSREDTTITLSGSTGKLVMPDIFFRRSKKNWLKKKSLPSTPLPVWDTSGLKVKVDIVKNKIPVIFGDKNAEVTYQGETVRIPVDIFGSAFFMLTRYEEVVVQERDEHDRFPAKSSLAYKEDFLMRPIIDEYLEILWKQINRLWPGLERKEDKYRLVLTHDVDRPFSVKNVSFLKKCRKLGGDILRRKSTKLFLKRFLSIITPGELGDNLDPANTFDLLMNKSEKRGLVSKFYFKAASTSKFDHYYDLFSPRIQKLLKNIAKRGHLIGLHPSYETLGNPNILKKEKRVLEKSLFKAGVEQPVKTGRQHYLRWQAERTWDNWANVGMSEDSSLGYAQHVGFRAGTCHKYQAWSWQNQSPLKLIEQPLIVMDGTLFEDKYMGLSINDALKALRHLSRSAKMVNGQFVVLWHNDFSKRAGQVYDMFLAEVQ